MNVTPKARILIIDDDPDFVEATRIVLEGGGYEVISALEGNDGLRKAKEGKPQLILLDVIMPGTDGRKVLEEITRLNPAAGVLMLSGFSRDYVRGYLPSGPWRLMQKPFEPEQLVSVTRRLLEPKPS